MRENADLVRLGTLLQGAACGTYAGEGLTQEQHAVLRDRGVSLGDVEIRRMLVAKRPPSRQLVPDEHHSQSMIEMMDCPIVAPNVALMPDGLLLALRGRS